MNVQTQIDKYIAAQPAAKQKDLQELNHAILRVMPECRLWFLDGKDDSGKTVSNPSIGYGSQTLTYADGKTREFYQIGISATTTRISVYIIGLKDKKYLSEKYGSSLGQASVTGYCIKFRSLGKINLDKLVEAIRDGVEQSRA